MLDLWLLLKEAVNHLDSTGGLDRDGRAPKARPHGVTTRTEHTQVCSVKCRLNLTGIVLKRDTCVFSLFVCFFVVVSLAVR